MAVIPQTQLGPPRGGNFEYHWSGPFLEAHLLSDVGKKRQRNEDGCTLCVPEDRELARERGILFAVADGMGGVSGGDFASRLGLQTLVEEYYARNETTAPERLQEAVSQANRRIFQEAENHPEFYGMGTTMCALLVHGDHAYIAHVGDSRLYLYRDALYQVTEDHSLVAEQVRNGYISEDEARTHSLKNLITRAVGTKDAVKADLYAVRLKVGDTIMMCSDGLSNLVDDNTIAGILTGGNLQGAARVLVGRALEGGAPDNVTVLLVRVLEQPFKTSMAQGAKPVTLGKPGLFGSIRRLFS
ncbi:MAG: Stp1/IreP family PP2C-type Ser/Thr phosphatase [Candidatus Hydrogenedentes bacterium]|nr:Stp1/IreP family PP2C-type Ser/Thr phosphatase [Candidatus Hydrogenedentota bacterium]